MNSSPSTMAAFADEMAALLEHTTAKARTARRWALFSTACAVLSWAIVLIGVVV